MPVGLLEACKRLRLCGRWWNELWTLASWSLQVVDRAHPGNAWNRSGPVLSRLIELSFEQELSSRLSEPVGSQ